MTYFYVATLSKTPLFLTAHYKTYDALFSFQKTQESLHLKDIVVIGVDDASFEKMNKAWPWGREVFAVFLENLQKLDPKVVGMDFSFVGESQNKQADEWLAEAVKARKNVILASYFDKEDSDQIYVTSAPVFLTAPVDFGFINIPYDTDNVNRRTRVLMPLANNQGIAYSFATQVAYAFLGAHPNKYVKVQESDVVFSYPEDYGMSLKKIPLDRRYHITTAFRYQPEQFMYIPFWKVIAGQVRKDAIKGKIVLVGPVSQILHDRHPTSIGRMAGIFINANQVLMILDKDFIQKVWPNYIWALLMLLAVIFTVVFFEMSYIRAALTFFITEIALVFISAQLFIYSRILFPLLPAFLIVMATFVLVMFYKSFGAYFQNMALQKQVVRDGLTGLYGHSYLMHRLNLEFDNFRRLRKEFCLVMIDVDFFKSVNDKYGHEKGNEVLKSIAQILKNNIRLNDVAARYGGEEFCLILLDSHVMGVYNTIERIRVAVEKHVFKVPGREDFHVTISSGIASNQSPGINKTEDMVQAADAMLYVAKEGGRNKTKINGV